MAGRLPMAASRATTYEVRCAFRAPLDYVFRWCTDYTPDDARLEKARYERRILSRSARRIVYEDLEDSGRGWDWSRQTVTLRPPDRWHAHVQGNLRTWEIDYRLAELGDGGTELRFRGVRRPTALGPPNPSRARMEPAIARGWAGFARALERDYGRARRGPGPRRTERCDNVQVRRPG